MYDYMCYSSVFKALGSDTNLDSLQYKLCAKAAEQETGWWFNGKMIKQNSFTSFSIGVVHGLAGIAHFILFLPVLGFKSQLESVTYILGFGSGIILAMTTFAIIIGKISSFSKHGHNEFFFNGIRLGGGVFAAVIGIYWLFGFMIF